MIRIQIEPVWRFTKDDGSRSMLVMLDFLHEIRTTGKITRAADQAAMSYRHAWNLIEKWSAFFEAPLVDRRQGRGTTLTPLGEKLVWAGQRLRARLKPQLDNLSQELETEINQLLPHGPSIIRVHASHGFAVAKLREMLSCEPDIGVDLRYVSNQTSLASLARGECDLAGMHLPQGELRQRSIAACKGWLSPTQHRIDGTRINGYAQFEFTHAAVAAYVASGMADVSFGVEAAAKQFDLGFVPLLTEDYFFVCQKPLLQLEAMKRVLSIMRSPAFHAAISALPGYAVKDAGSIKTAAEVFKKQS